MTRTFLLILIVMIKSESSQSKPLGEVSPFPLTHIARQRENPLEPSEPGRYTARGDLKILHSPCEFDLLISLRGSGIEYFPKYCQPIYQNRYVNEYWYRLYRTYDAEGFVFGQFAERLQRYELDTV